MAAIVDGYICCSCIMWRKWAFLLLFLLFTRLPLCSYTQLLQSYAAAFLHTHMHAPVYNPRPHTHTHTCTYVSRHPSSHVFWKIIATARCRSKLWQVEETVDLKAALSRLCCACDACVWVCGCEWKRCYINVVVIYIVMRLPQPRSCVFN